MGEGAIGRDAKIDRRQVFEIRHRLGAAEASERHGGAADLQHRHAPAYRRVAKIVDQVEDIQHGRTVSLGDFEKL